jgi:hypothetical protein
MSLQQEAEPPSHVYNTYFVADLRLVLDGEVQAARHQEHIYTKV